MNDARLLEEYLTEVRGLPTVPATERADLVERARGGDAEARKRAIESLLPEAATVATSECPVGMRVLDAIQEANVVVVRLVDDEQVPDPASALGDAVRRHLSALAVEGE